MKERFNIIVVVAAIGLFAIPFPQNNLLAQCPGLGNITLTVVAAPVPTLTAPPQLCPGANGTVAVSQTFSTYAWNTGGSGQSIAITDPGTYTVTVSNSAGCTGTATANVTAAPVPTPNITQNTYTCNGSITLNAGAGFTTYAWSNGGGSGQTATYSTAGNYTVTVTNAQGCTGTDDFTVTIPTPPVVTISGNLNICTGQSTVLNATAGFSTYAWSGGGSSASLTVSAGGTYTVTVTDSFGCTDTESATVVAGQSPAPTVANADVCPGSTVTLSVSNAPFQGYDWNTGSTSSTTTANAPGTYTVTVTAANGCTGTTTANVALLTAPNPNITPNTYTCNGQITLNAGPSFTTYAWSNGINAQLSSVNSSGTYTVTVTNAQGCTGTDEFLVNIPTPPVVNVSGDASFCDGASADLNATPGLVTYAWSSGQSGANITVTVGNTYTVTATDAFGCTATDNFIVTELPAPLPVINGPAQVCDGATATFSTSVNFLGYSWSNGQTTPDITVGTAGTYTVTVTAANGCTGTDSQALALLPAPNPAISQNIYTCNGQITLNAGPGFTSYAWSNGLNAQLSTVNSNGTYTVTVTNAQGCTGTDNFAVTIPTPPVVNITGDDTFCEGAAADLNATPGLVNYAWSSGQNGANISVTNGGNFTVTATDNFGCTATDIFTVAELLAPTPVIAGPSTICSGATATFNTTAGFVAYNWSNGQTTPTITVGTAGTYAVTATASNGCTGTDTQVLTVTPAPSPIISQAPYACDDQLTLNAGPGFTAYTWAGPNGQSANSQLLTANANGTYTVTVTNAQGCTGTDTYLADIPVPPVVSITGGSTICPGSTTTLDATPGFSSYLWSTTSSNPNISVSTAGNYAVTVTDPFGCTASDEFSVSVLAAPAPNISGPSQICATGSATFSVPGTFTIFNWSTGVNTPTITVSTANTYTVTVTAANGCTGTDTQILTVANSLQPQITELPYACDGQITLDAGTGFSTYNWSGGQSAQSITISVDGTFTVTVSDATGCTGTAVAAATLPPAPTVEVSGNTPICTGSTTTISATPGLTSYVWNTGQVGASIPVGVAGPYTVTATDALGCTVTDDFLLTTTPAPQPIIAGPNVICTNSSGTLDAGAGFATYVWAGPNGFTFNGQQPTVNIGGAYTVTVTNALGCTGTDAQTVTEATGLAPTLTQQPYTCNNQITLDAGAGFASYAWSNGPNSQFSILNSNGTYTVTVTDATGCTGTGTLAVTIPTSPQVFVSGKNSFCQNENTTLEATSGFATYQWSNGETSSSVTVNQSNVFTVTITDNLGCTDTESIAVTAQPLPQPQIAGPATVCVGNSATLSVGQTFVSYAWVGPNGLVENTAQITASNAGTYTVTVTDANGCTGIDDAVLVVNQNPVPAIVETPYACDGQITLDAGAGFNIYTWSNGPNSQFSILNSNGTYTVTVTNANGCTGTATLATTVPALNLVAVSGPTQFCNGGSVDLVATPGFVSYAWSNGPTLPNITANTVGVYVVTATDALGCTSTAAVSVGVFPSPVPTIAGPTAVCPGNTATLNVVGNYASLEWSTGPTTASITVQPPFTATVTVTDANGCTGTASAAVIVSNQLSPSIVQQPYACNSQITLDAGTGFTTYAWSNGLNTPLSTVNANGIYTVTVSDGGGCSGTATIQVTLPTPPQVALSGDTQICPAEVSTLTATPGFTTYAWSNGFNTPLSVIDQAGTYTVTATDALGCTATATLAVQSLTPPAPSIAGPTTICGSNPITLDAGAGFATYSWSGPNGFTANSQQPTANSPGTYSVTVTDANGCTGAAQTAIQSGGNLTAIIAKLPYACDGQITLDAGAGYATYAWSNGQNAQFSMFNSSGIYTVTVTDAGGCSGTATAQVIIPTTVVPEVFSVPSLCPGASITSIVTNQQNFVQFVWNTGETGSFITGVVGGKTYAVTVTDANGCTQTAGFTIALSPTPAPTVTQLPYTCNGQITLDAGSGFATYAWSNGLNSQFSIINSNGIYTVTVTNNLACPGTATVQVTIPPNPVASIAGQTTFCAGSSTVLTAPAGFIAYAWAGPNGFSANTQQSTATSPGTYTVTVTNGNGCTATASVTMQTGSLVPALQSNEVFCQGTTLTISVSGNYAKYLWSDGSVQPSLTVSQVGVYTVTVTDAAGCTGSATSQVLAVPPASVSISGGGTICGGSSATLTTSGSAGTFAWSNGAGGTLLTVTQAGTYTVTVTDPNGCTATDSETVLTGAPVTVLLNRTSCRLGDVGAQTLTLVAANGCDSVVTIVTTYQPTKPGLALDTEPVVQATVGQSVTLEVSANFVVDSVSWVSPFALSCADCLSPTLTATASGLLQVTAFDPEGCRAAVELRIAVSKTVDLYVPNVLRHGSTDNGFLSVFSGPEIQFVRNFNVYDRWGNALFSRNDMPTNDPAAGWDGTFRNQKMQPGVYVYYFEVLLADGSVEVRSGDVTLVE